MTFGVDELRGLSNLNDSVILFHSEKDGRPGVWKPGFLLAEPLLPSSFHYQGTLLQCSSVHRAQVSAELRVPTMFVYKRWQEPDIIAARFSSVVQLLTEGWLLSDGVSKAEVHKVFKRQWNSRLSLGIGAPRP